MEAKSKQKFQPVRPEDFDVRLLRRLAREGRLYFDPNEPSPELISEDKEQEVMLYVEPISECVTPTYVPFITLIWKAIIHDPQLNDRLFITKGRHTGQLNRYRMMALVNVLHSMGVYANKTYNLLQLHNLMEHTDKKTPVYSSRLNYALTNPQCRYLRGVIHEILDK